MFKAAPDTAQAWISAAREAALSNPAAAYAIAVLVLAIAARKASEWI